MKNNTAEAFWKGYHSWNKARIDMIHSLVDPKPITVLDMGCGHGSLGKSFEDIGCNVTYSDVIDQRIYKTDAEFLKLDVDSPEWECLSERTFDLVLNCGLLYHTHNPYLVLKLTLSLFKKHLILETEVSVGKDISVGVIEKEDQGEFIDRSFRKIGIRPNQQVLESQLTMYCLKVRRYDSEYLNSGMHIYNWKPEEVKQNTYLPGYRRFYHITPNF